MRVWKETRERVERAPTCIACDVLLSRRRECFCEFVNLVLDRGGGQGEGWIAGEGGGEHGGHGGCLEMGVCECICICAIKWD
jgi:hypothetical protein